MMAEKMTMTMEVSNLLVKKCIRELSGLAEKHLPDAQYRVYPVWNVGRKIAKLDHAKSKFNFLRYFNKFSVVDHVHTTSGAGVDGLIAWIVTVVDNKFKIMQVSADFEVKRFNLPLKMVIVKTQITISKHALARWMYRNQSDDYRVGLKVLLSSLLVEDKKIAHMVIDDGVIPVGSCERQIACSDGGISIVSIKDPSEDDYALMNWTLITYLDPSLIMEWNEVAVNSNYSNIQDFVGDRF